MKSFGVGLGLSVVLVLYEVLYDGKGKCTTKVLICFSERAL